MLLVDLVQPCSAFELQDLCRAQGLLIPSGLGRGCNMGHNTGSCHLSGYGRDFRRVIANSGLWSTSFSVPIRARAQGGR